MANNYPALKTVVPDVSPVTNVLANAPGQIAETQRKNLLTGLAVQKQQFDITKATQDQKLQAMEWFASAASMAKTPEDEARLLSTTNELFPSPTGQPLFDQDDIPVMRQWWQGQLAQKRQAAGAGVYGNVIEGVDENGQTVPMALSKGGVLQRLPLPEGVKKYTPPVKPLDVGTAFQLMSRGGQLGGTVKKDLRGAKREEEIGKGRGKAVVELPKVEQQTSSMLGAIDDVLNDPALDTATGWQWWRGAVWGTSQYAFARKVDQIAGKAFLQAFQQLKGGGQITEIEGEKATNAIARLQRPQSPADFRKALQDLRDVAKAGRQKAYEQAGQGAPARQAPSPTKRYRWNPETGKIE